MGMWMLFFCRDTRLVKTEVFREKQKQVKLSLNQEVDLMSRCANLESLGHDAAHDSADPQSPLHVQLAKGGLELIDGDQPGTDGGRSSAEQIQLPAKTQCATMVEYLVFLCRSG